jgi:hypothetical protein
MGTTSVGPPPAAAFERREARYPLAHGVSRGIAVEEEEKVKPADWRATSDYSAYSA